MLKIILAAATAILLTACGGGDSEAQPSIHETVASSQFLGASGNTHVNQVDAITVDVDSTVTIVVEGDFVATGPAGALIYSRFAPIWSIDGRSWGMGDGSPALQEIRLASPGGASYRLHLRATQTIDLPAGSSVSAGIFFVDHITAQTPGRLVNARTRVEVAARR
jgi:hypothetical protein